MNSKTKITKIQCFLGGDAKTISIGDIFGTGMIVTDILETDSNIILKNETGSTLATFPKSLVAIEDETPVEIKEENPEVAANG